MSVIISHSNFALTTFAYDLAAAGTGQNDATLVEALRNVFSSVPVGTGARLKDFGGPTETVILNRDPLNTLNVYPPKGWFIEGQAPNNPVTIIAGQSATFMSSNPNAASVPFFYVR